ncbi:hypothetical protein QR680_004509 [Steinernema hermaphroditum]|uniref:Uncharacterized protein n=1 Tax=Steinernema hermaphroditum TaxID=289476 RepID=A0AA39HNZ4_9BILA|nr:hypothetical protein QR680_004509 [Steinernema hermaphroditum]
MDTVPTVFIIETQSLMGWTRQLLQLSSEWGRVAAKREKKKPTSLYLKKSAQSDAVFFAFSDGDLWDSIQNNPLCPYYVHEVYFCKEGLAFSHNLVDNPEHLAYHELNPSNLRKLCSILSKNSYGVTLNLVHSVHFDMTRLMPLIWAVPRVIEFSEDKFKGDPTLSLAIFRRAVERGTLLTYAPRGEVAVTQDHLDSFETLAASRVFRRLAFVWSEESEVPYETMLHKLVDKWLHRNDVDRFMMEVSTSKTAVMREMLEAQGLQMDLQDGKMEIFTKEGRRFRVRYVPLASSWFAFTEYFNKISINRKMFR